MIVFSRLRRLRGAVAAVIWAPAAQRLLDRGAQLLGGERLDHGGRKHDAELFELERGRGDTGADDRQRWIGGVSSPGKRGAGWCRRLDHQYVRTPQLRRSRSSDEDRLVAETGDHALQQSSDVIVGLADKYSCHVSMIDGARWISGGRMV